MLLYDHLTRSYLSLWGRMDKTVVVAPPLVLFFRCPHSRVCLSGAVWQRRITCVIFPNRSSLVVFCFVTLGENKGLLLWTWQSTKEISVLGSRSFHRRGILGVSSMFCIWWRKDALKLLPLVLESEAGVHGQDPVVFLCFFKHSLPTWSLQCLWQFIPQSERQKNYWD